MKKVLTYLQSLIPKEDTSNEVSQLSKDYHNVLKKNYNVIEHNQILEHLNFYFKSYVEHEIEQKEEEVVILKTIYSKLN